MPVFPHPTTTGCLISVSLVNQLVPRLSEVGHASLANELVQALPKMAELFGVSKNTTTDCLQNFNDSFFPFIIYRIDIISAPFQSTSQR